MTHVPSGEKVVIVDDVITSGYSIEKAIGAVEQRHCTVVKVITLVDRHEGGSDRIRAKGYSFQSILDFQTVGGKTVRRYPRASPWHFLMTSFA